MSDHETGKSETVECLDLYCNLITVPKTELRFRPASYGLTHQDGVLLMIRMPPTRQYILPGGGIELGETSAAAVIRETREEAGLDVRVDRFFAFRDYFGYYNPTKSANHCVNVFYACSVIGDPRIPPGAGDPAEGEPIWVDPRLLTEQNCHPIFLGVIREYLTVKT